LDPLTDNPFASTHSLDTNPFDDPSDPPTGPHSDRLEELNRRERELQAREQELNKKAEHIRTHGKNNFPPFFPLIFHSIADEIPEASRPLMTRIFQLWLLLLATLIINLVACIFILLAGSSDGGRDVGASAMYLPVIGLVSFLTWYRPIYNAYMKEQSLYYYFFFFFCGWHLLFTVYAIIGVPSTGLAGLINTIQMYSRGAIVAGILGTISTVGWILQGAGIGFFYRQIWAHHTAAGHSVAQARSELAQHGAKAYFTRG
ncbi:scamp-domain-containing protein, partial [Ramaria rubella]